jgi:hypothetical protein
LHHCQNLLGESSKTTHNGCMENSEASVTWNLATQAHIGTCAHRPCVVEYWLWFYHAQVGFHMTFTGENCNLERPCSYPGCRHGAAWWGCHVLFQVWVMFQMLASHRPAVLQWVYVRSTLIRCVD